MPRKSKLEAIHPDHHKSVARLRRVRGQIDGIEKMIVQRKYCPDIMIQLKAAQSALKSLEMNVLETHLKHCVTNAMKESSSAKRNEKIEELLNLFSKS